jgi:hypothetical protein
MYAPTGDLESFGRKAIKFADQVQDTAARVSGAIKGAAVGAKTAPAHPYAVPAAIGAGVFLAFYILTRKGK